jgi:hypothetical protein
LFSYNKRDLPDVLWVAELAAQLNPTVAAIRAELAGPASEA